MVNAIDYAGDLSCQEAFELLKADPGSRLIDVRTAAEWTFVGLPDLTGLGKKALLVEWQRAGGVRNDGFVAEAEAALAGTAAPNGAPILLLCRSGARSAAAAAALTEAGYGPAYNILNGFEGDLDADGHRGRRNGWKVSGLPWRQS